MDGLGRAIGAGVPIQFNGETLILDGVTVGDFGLIEQHLLAQRPNPLDLARPQAMEFIREAAKLSAGITLRQARLAVLEKLPKPLATEKKEAESLTESIAYDEAVRSEYIAMAEKLMAEARTEAMKKNKMPPREVAEWLDTFDGAAFTIWLKLDQRYPNRFTLKQTHEIMQAMQGADLENIKRLRDQASGFDALGNSTGPTSATATVGRSTGG